MGFGDHGLLRGAQIAIYGIFMTVDMRDTGPMTQYAHARALHLLADIGVDPDDATWFMKRLYDLGFTVTPRDTGPGASPPDTTMHPAKAARGARRQAYLDQMRAEVEQAREQKAAELADAIKTAEAAEKEQKAAHQRTLAVQRVLADLG